MGASRARFRERQRLAPIHDKERTLTRDVTDRVERAIPGTEVLALELSGPESFTVYVDHAGGVDHALCGRVTDVLRDYLRDYSIDVSSPGLERPVRTRAHFERAVGRKVVLRTAQEVQGRKRFRGRVKEAGASGVTLGIDGAEDVAVPYAAIVRGNLIEEG